MVTNLENLSHGVTEDIAFPLSAIIRWTIDNVPFFTNYQSPTLSMIEQGNSSYPIDYNGAMLNGDENTVLFLQTLITIA